MKTSNECVRSCREASILWKKQVRTIAADLEKMDSSDRFDNTCRETEKGYHVKLYTRRGCFCGDISRHCDELFNIAFFIKLYMVYEYKLPPNHT